MCDSEESQLACEGLRPRDRGMNKGRVQMCIARHEVGTRVKRAICEITFMILSIGGAKGFLCLIQATPAKAARRPM